MRSLVKAKRSADTDAKRAKKAKKHIPAELLGRGVDEWTLAHADTAMANIPAARSDGTRYKLAGSPRMPREAHLFTITRDIGDVTRR